MAVIVREKVKDSGEWWVFINHKGKRRSKKIGTKTAANKVAREVEERLAKGDMGMLRGECPTVAQYGKEWLFAPYHDWKDSTKGEYERAFNFHVKPRLGSKRLNEIKRVTVKTLLAQLKEQGLSPSRRKTVKNVVSGILNSAIEDELIEANPCRRMGKYTGSGNVRDIDPLTAEEVSTLLQNAQERLSDTSYTLFLVAVRTGLRIGEILALEWSDIDFDERTAEISKNWDYKRRTLGSPKNDKSRRVDLTPGTVEALRKLRRTTKVVSLDGVIFEDDKGNRLVYSTLYRALKKVAPRAIRIHDLRHTYATLRVAKGDNIVDVSNQLGHHAVGFTLDKYAHWMPGEHKSQVDELDEIAPIRTPTAP
jgi:integrase